MVEVEWELDYYIIKVKTDIIKKVSSQVSFPLKSSSF